MHDTLEAFTDYFPPNPTKYGRFNDFSPDGRKACDTVNTPASVKELEGHLLGTGGYRALGYLPGGPLTTNVGVIDLDGKDYPAPGALADAREAVTQVLKDAGIHVYSERSSRGNGYHLWVFLNNGVPYAELSGALKGIVVEAGLASRTEVYPLGGAANGRWVILPYATAGTCANRLGTTYLETEDGQAIPYDELDEWLERADATVVLAFSRPDSQPAGGATGYAGTPGGAPLERLKVAASTPPTEFSRHDAAGAFLNVAGRSGDGRAMAEFLGSREVYDLWITDKSRSHTEWQAELGRWLGAQGPRKYGLTYLRNLGFPLPYGHEFQELGLLELKHKPTETYNERYVRPLNLTARATFLEAAHGTGKTTAVKAALKGADKVLVITHRRTLSRKLSNDFSVANYQDVECLWDHQDSLVVTVDSLPQLTPDHFCGATVFIDEVSQVFDHLKGDTVKPERSKVLQALGFILNQADRAVFCDADLNDPSITYALELMGEPAGDFIRNGFVGEGFQAVEYADKQSLVDYALKSIGDGRVLAVASDSAAQTTELGELISKKNPAKRVLVINSHTTTRPEVQVFLTTPDALIKDYDVLIYSPSMWSGVDISTEDYVDDVVLFVNDDTLSSKDAIQAVRRVRHPKSRTVHFFYTQKTNVDLVTDPDEIEAELDARAEAVRPLTTLVKGAWRIDPQFDAYVRYYSTSTAERNYYRRAPKHFFLLKLAARGFKVTVNTTRGDKGVSEELKVVRRELKDKQVQALKAVVTPDALEALGLEEKDARTEEEDACLLRFYYYRLNGHDETGLDDLFETDYATLKRQVFNLRDLLDEVHNVKLRDAYNNRKTVIKTDFDVNYRAAELAREVEATYEGFRHTGSIGNLSRFVDYHKKNKDEIERWLGYKVGKNIDLAPMQTLGYYLRRFGLKLVGKNLRVGTGFVRLYSIDPASRERLLAVVERRLKGDAAHARRIEKEVGKKKRR